MDQLPKPWIYNESLKKLYFITTLKKQFLTFCWLKVHPRSHLFCMQAVKITCLGSSTFPATRTTNTRLLWRSNDVEFLVKQSEKFQTDSEFISTINQQNNNDVFLQLRRPLISRYSPLHIRFVSRKLTTALWDWLM